MITLGEYTHRHVWPEPNLSNFPSATTLTTLIDLYLVNFAPWLPILSGPTASADVGRMAPILLQAMAAVGAVYGDENIQRLGLSMNEIVRREILWTVSVDPSPSAHPSASTTSGSSWKPRSSNPPSSTRSTACTTDRQSCSAKPRPHGPTWSRRVDG
jgi:hypothetical protein